MRRYLVILLACTLAVTLSAQKKKPVQKQKARTTKVVKKKSTAKASTKKTTKVTNSAISGLENQRKQIQKKIRQQEQALKANKADVQKRLQDLMVLNGEIDERQKSIEGIQKDIHHIDGNIDILKSQLKTLSQQLAERKAKYIKSMRYMARHQSVQDRLMFIFSAKNLAQMYRRLRFVREYAAYQRAQGEAVKAKQEQVDSKHEQLREVRGQKNTLLSKGQQEKDKLVGQQDEQQKIVGSLQKQQQVIQKIIDEQRAKNAALNAEIDRLVAQEVAKARARAIAEAKRKAAAAAAAKKRAEELARQKAAAEAAARENARRIAEAKEREAKAKEAARAAAEAERKAKEEQTAAAAKAAAERKARLDQEAREAQAARQAAELKAKTEEARNREAIATAKKKADDAEKLSSVDRMMNGGFEANRGRLPMPVTGGYKIVTHFGSYNVDGLSHVRLDSKGIDIKGSPGCAARSIYDGEVSGVFSFRGQMVVMVRHGAYISVYCNLSSVSVSKGQRVSTRQALGTVGGEGIMQFQLRRGSATLNPEAWLGR